MRLIDADSLKIPYEDGNSLFAIACAPTIDAVPVVHGRWILRDNDVRCKVCNTKCLRDDIGINILSNYCPSCGARMDGEEKRNEVN